MKTVKTSSYRQRGYLFHSSGEFVIVYGEDQVPVSHTDASEVPRLVWDNDVQTITTSVSRLAVASDAPVSAEHAD